MVDSIKCFFQIQKYNPQGRIQTVATVAYATVRFSQDISFQGVPFLKLLKTKKLSDFVIADIFNFWLQLGNFFSNLPNYIDKILSSFYFILDN